MKIKVIFFILILVLGNIFFLPKDKRLEDVNEYVNNEERIVIELVGEVVFPGSYIFFEPIQLRKVIDYAGGFLDNASSQDINLNEILEKSKTIRVNSIEKEELPIYNKLININEASFQELINVPNITETRAANIIIYRQQYGKFNSLEDLLKVKYIGQAVYEKIIIYLTI